MENKTAKKAKKQAKKGILSVVFSRTALIFLLLLIQLLMMVGIATFLKDYIIYVYGILNVVGAIIVIYIINQRGNPAFNMTWVLLILIFPVFGCLFYLYVKGEFGTKYIGKRLGKLKLDTYPYMEQRPGIIDDLRLSKPANANLAHYMKHQLCFPTYRNTKATYFSCGEEKFPALLEQLEKAEKFIFMEYFIVGEGYMWDTILEVLKRKAQEGVEVRFMYDGMCSISLLPYNYPKIIRKYGIQCKMFSPIRPVLSTTQNNRDHRKICVVDGKVGFTGGINLADEYINKKVRFGYWKDTAIMLEGDAVQSLTMLFLQMWNATELKYGEQYQNYLTPMSTELHRELGFMIPYGDSPYDNEDVGEEVYFHILNHAKKYVHIMTPYLILDNEMLDTLTRAAKSGIEVCIIMPHIPDKWYAFAVAKTFYRDLIEAGVQIYEFTPGFVHAKIFVSDDDTATVGTINLDYRSLYLHFECGVFIYNNPVVREIEADFQKTLKQCQRISVSDLKKISPFMAICGRVLRLIAPLM
ncbi:cardiolipin synthase [Faecalicatena sp. AGMB00832]|uniref:Cardiolipin synthase n=1 Tax=Faecalicatena faecalis TaxID=2726362 RepID=A0ABS6D2V0_9FIRM|nr:MULTISPECIES: cardiolipin synthase [Faecalicatena]MBU3875532.1 cardiolipin synthase [Faecalicatena faecalis]MCI6466026.1 cardiolipin synthase [Faecalicatena sp.]MDY5620044.1 cardiolipin synthase [Lachnospiraceae bacterium]